MAATTAHGRDASRETIKRNLSVSTRSASNTSTSSKASTSPTTSRSSGGGGGILANADDPTPTSRRQNSTASTTGNISAALKSAFLNPPAPGKQIKRTSKPIGKSFERTTPLSPRETHAGAEVLPYDPRGSEASAGDGVVLALAGEEGDVQRQLSASPTSEVSDAAVSERPRAKSTASSSSAGSVNSSVNGAPGYSGSSSQSSAGSSSGGSSLCAIRFAPLPTSGRLKRANSITIGVAARSQLISSQGSGRSKPQAAAGWQSGQLHAPNYSAWQAPPQQQHQQQAPSWYAEPKRSAEVVDLGEELRKGALKAWRMMKSARSASPNTDKSQQQQQQQQGVSPGTAAPVNAALAGVQASEGVEGDATPKRARSPDPTHSSPTALDQQQPESYHVDGEDEHLAEGARTPRMSMVRRLSTGAFLGGDAVRGMQEQRRRDVLGLGPEAEQDETEAQEQESHDFNRFEASLGRNHPAQLLGGPRHAAAKMGEVNHTHEAMMVEPSNEEEVGETSEEQQQSGEEEVDEDDEEEREAQRLADEAAAHHSAAANKAAGIEISSAKRALKA